MTLFNGALCVCSVVGVCGEEWSVTYKSESTCAFVGSSVNLSCSYTYPSGLTITEVYWTKHNYTDPPPLRDDPDYRDRISEGCEQGTTRCNLRIKSLTTSDIGEYYFKITTSRSGQKWIGTPGIYLDVKGKDKQNLSTVLFSCTVCVGICVCVCVCGFTCFHVCVCARCDLSKK